MFLFLLLGTGLLFLIFGEIYIFRDSSVCIAIATGWTVRGSNPGGGEIFRTRPDRLWVSSHPPIEWATGLFAEVKRPVRGADHPSPSGAEVKERVELYLCFPSGRSWPVLGWNLPLPFTVHNHWKWNRSLTLFLPTQQMKQKRYIQVRNRIPPLSGRSNSSTADQLRLAVCLKKIMHFEGCSFVKFKNEFDFRCCAEQKHVVKRGCVMSLLKYSKNDTKSTWKNSIYLIAGSK
jgi:hypothetical protein